MVRGGGLPVGGCNQRTGRPSDAWRVPRYATLTPFALYRDFINGWFSTHVRDMVLPIEGQLVIAILMSLPRPWRTFGAAGAIVFLLAIAPLGVGSGFPFSVTFGAAVIVANRDGRGFLGTEEKRGRRGQGRTRSPPPSQAQLSCPPDLGAMTAVIWASCAARHAEVDAWPAASSEEFGAYLLGVRQVLPGRRPRLRQWHDPRAASDGAVRRRPARLRRGAVSACGPAAGGSAGDRRSAAGTPRLAKAAGQTTELSPPRYAFIVAVSSQSCRTTMIRTKASMP